MTGQDLSFPKHAILEFGAYVQTQNDRNLCSMGCICLEPTGNLQGSHWYLSRTSGDCVVCHCWTELPMPQAALTRFLTLVVVRRCPPPSHMPTLMATKVVDTLANYPNDDYSSSNDSSYADSTQQMIHPYLMILMMMTMTTMMTMPLSLIAADADTDNPPFQFKDDKADVNRQKTCRANGCRHQLPRHSLNS